MECEASGSDEEEEEENGNDIDDVSEQNDTSNESFNIGSNDSVICDHDDMKEEDNGEDTVNDELASEEDVVEEEDEEEDDEENEEAEEAKNPDEEEEEEEDVVEEEGKPQYKTIMGELDNPNMMTIMEQRNEGFPFVRFTAKDGYPIDFDMMTKRDRETVRGLIHSPMKGSVWKVFRKEEVKSKEIKKQKKTGRNHAPGFTTPSDDEEDTTKVSSAKNETTIKSRGKKATKETNAKKVKAGCSGGNSKPAASKTTTSKKAAAAKVSSGAPSGKTTKKTARTCKTAKEKKGAAKKTSASPNKGKVVVMDRDDDDDDSLDLDNMVDAAEAMAESLREERMKKPIVISVSGVFHNVADGYSYYLVTFSRGYATFYFKAECARSFIDLAYKKRKLVNPDEDGTWIQTITSINVRAVEFGEESLWFKTSSNNTVDVTQFIHAVPIGEEDDFLPNLKAKIKYFFDVTRKRKTNITGKLVLKYCMGRKTAGLGKFCLRKGTTHKGTAKEVVSEEKTADVMTQELHDHYRDGYTLQYDVPLNKFMVDYDIKAFLTTYIGSNSWDDLSQEDKRKCYRDYPKKSLPDWDAIEQETY